MYAVLKETDIGDGCKMGKEWDSQQISTNILVRASFLKNFLGEDNKANLDRKLGRPFWGRDFQAEQEYEDSKARMSTKHCGGTPREPGSRVAGRRSERRMSQILLGSLGQIQDLKNLFWGLWEGINGDLGANLYFQIVSESCDE